MTSVHRQAVPSNEVHDEDEGAPECISSEDSAETTFFDADEKHGPTTTMFLEEVCCNRCPQQCNSLLASSLFKGSYSSVVQVNYFVRVHHLLVRGWHECLFRLIFVRILDGRIYVHPTGYEYYVYYCIDTVARSRVSES
jgi:hypothetical protein